MFKKDFPIFSKNNNLIFLDSASSTQKPAMVINGMKDFFENTYSNIHRGAYDLSMNASILYEKSKKKFAEFISADSHHEIVFTYNATYAFNLIVRALVKTHILEKWDKILLSKADHHANIVPWQIIAEEYGIEILWIGLHTDGTLDYEDIQAKIHDVKLISITGASNVTGEVLDLEKMSEILLKCEKKPLFVVDASQRFPHLATNVKKYGIDIFVTTAHKNMADTGLGVFYAKKDLLKALNPAFCGGGAINGVTIEWYSPAGLPFRHEPGTPHIAWAVSLLKALEYIESIGGYEVVEKYEKNLTEYALWKISEILKNFPKKISLLGSKNWENRLWVFAFAFTDLHPHDVAEMLADENICVRSGHHCAEPLHQHLGIGASLRMSLYVYNTQEDIDIFCEKIQKILKK